MRKLAAVYQQCWGRQAFGFEIDRKFYRAAKEWIDLNVRVQAEVADMGFSPTALEIKHPLQKTLFAH